MTVNEFDQFDRPLRTDYDYPGSSQDEGVLHRYDRHFENGLLIMGTATLINSLSHNHRGSLPGSTGLVMSWIPTTSTTKRPLPIRPPVL
jgi:hypothetical protein